jgi:putative peptidoglycan lipid II flippase
MILASLLPVGAISFLYYADRLYQLPLSVIGTAIGTALLPMLARALKSGDAGGAQRLFTRGFDISLVLALPSAAAFIAVAPVIMDVLFVRGAFTAEDSRGAAYALMAYSIGLPAFVLSKILASVFFAQEDTRTPVKFAVVCAVMNTALALVLIHPLQHVGLALATGLTAWVNVVLLARGLWKRKMVSFEKDSVKRAAVVCAVSAVMGLGLYYGDVYLTPLFAGQGQVLRVAGLAVLLGAGALFYGAGLYFTGILNATMVKELFPKRKKKDTIGDVSKLEQQDLGQ